MTTSAPRFSALDSDRRPPGPVILIVDDDAGDQVLIQEALQASQAGKKIYMVGDGEEALDYLNRTGRWASSPAPRPDLILLDLNMPRLGGRELLPRLKSDPRWKTTPVVVFTTSNREDDVAYCYAAGASSYVQKPSDFDRFQEVLSQIESYWLRVSLSPPPP